MTRQIIVAVRPTGLVQTRGRMMSVDGVQLPVEGSARIFLLAADEHRSAKLAKVREWLRLANHDEHWVSGDRAADVRALVVVRRMAATRLGFPNLYAALNDGAPSSIKEGLKDGTTWPLKPFLTYLLPLARAVNDNRGFEVMTLLRAECPQLSSAGLAGANAPDVLMGLQTSTEEIARLMLSNEVAFRDVLLFASHAGLLQLDGAWTKYLDADPAALAADDDPEVPAVTAFLNCRVGELTAYRHYLEDLSPYATQQGVKGAEFDGVLVIIDDEEGQGQRQFSYEKYFGIAPLSDKDDENIAAGLDNVVDSLEITIDR